MMKYFLIFVCLGMIFAQGIIGGGDHDIIAHKLVTLTGDLRERSVEELRDYCLKLESWKRDNKKDMHGGIHDYVWRLDQEACIKYILSVALKYTELLDMDTFRATVSPVVKFLEAVAEPSVGFGGLEDYIFRLDRETLSNFAFSAEKYHHEQQGQSMIIGGLHDKIRDMSNLEIAEYVLEKAKLYKDLNSYENLEKLSLKYGFSKKLNQESLKVGGLHDYIFRQPRETLEKWALTTEAHHRAVKNIQILGGLHDYINTLSSEELVQYVLKEASEHPELDSAEELNRYASVYGITH